MNKRLKRVIYAICTVMLCSVWSGHNSFAAEVKTFTEDVRFIKGASDENFNYYDETITRSHEIPEKPLGVKKMKNPVSTMSIEEIDGSYYFTTFEDLKELAADSYSEWCSAIYQGEGDLIISQNLELPENLVLYVLGQNLTIPAGVSFNAGEVYADTVVVEGTAYVDSLYVDSVLTITGKLCLNQWINLVSTTVLTGEEKIDYLNSWGGISVDCHVEDTATLKEAIALANESNNSRKQYSFDIWSDNEEGFTIDESVTVPENSSLYVGYGCPIKVVHGCTLTLNGTCFLNYSTMLVEGILCNNDLMYVDYDQGEILTIADGGTYMGKGCLVVYSDSLTDVSDAIPGLDTSNFEVVEYWDDNHYWEIKNIDGLTKLANPTDLEWGYEHFGESAKEEKPGMISWKTKMPDQGHAQIRIYKDGEKNPYSTFFWEFSALDVPEWRSVDSFILDDPDSGTYYFTITSEGDDITYYNSDPVASDTWSYTKPSAKVDSCSDLSWDWPSIKYSAPADMANVGGYEVEWYYASSENEDPEPIGGSWSSGAESIFTAELWDSAIQEHGLGFYYFKIRATTSDMTVACNGEWSDFSPVYNLTEISKDTEGKIKEIAANIDEMSEGEIRDAIQAVNTEELKTAMLADSDGTGIMTEIEALEQTVGGPVTVEVADEAAAFDKNEISIVGANLNDAASSDPIKLVIDKPEKDHVIDTMYDNSLAVKFSMDLVNVENSKDLEVPVRITLPVPASINPDFLVILHYHADGSMEELALPYIYCVGRQWYASFVLTSFSDFVMTQLTTTTPMYRLYNSNSGEHFYTGSEEERENLTAVGWKYEGIAWNAPITSGEPVYRLFNPNNGDHHYTMSWEEVQMLQEVGWNYEGVCWNSASSDNLPLYRLYNPNADCGSHHYTGSTEERDNLKSLGWNYEGIGWFGTEK